MIWIFITFVVLAFTYAKLGAMSVWFHMLSAAFNFLLVLLLGVIAYFFWKSRSKHQASITNVSDV